jgi:hypothetical protein
MRSKVEVGTKISAPTFGRTAVGSSKDYIPSSTGLRPAPTRLDAIDDASPGTRLFGRAPIPFFLVYSTFDCIANGARNRTGTDLLL